MKVAIERVASYELAEVRAGVRRALASLGRDGPRPLAGVVRPGDRVFIKPNWVAHEYRRSCPRQDSVWSTITHPAVIRAVAELVAEALEGRGEIRIGDNPSIDADFDKLRALVQLDDLQGQLGVPVRLMDLRPLRCADLADYGKRERMVAQPGDPEGAVEVDLAGRSLLHRTSPRLLHGVFDDRSRTVSAHTGPRQLYSFSGSIAKADVYISLPKLKTHHKAGVTLNLKGLVGTVAEKDLLAHWRVGFPAMGGDEYPSFWAWLRGRFAKVKHRGSWPGNDTIWRMVVDLSNGFAEVGPRRTFSIVDGIVGGEGDGPFCPVSKPAGVLLAGDDLLAVDCAATRLMGFDPLQVPYLRHLLQARGLRPDEAAEPASSSYPLEGFFDLARRHLDFQPPTHWSALRSPP